MGGVWGAVQQYRSSWLPLGVPGRPGGAETVVVGGSTGVCQRCPRVLAQQQLHSRQAASKPAPHPCLCCRYINGQHYSRTLEDWLKLHDAARSSIMPLFEQTYGKAQVGG